MSKLIPLPQRPQFRLILRIVLGSVLAIVAIYFISRQVDWETALDYIRDVSLQWLALAVITVFFNNIAKSFRWRLLFPPDQPLPRQRDIFGVLMSGQLINLLLPLRSGDITRAYFMGRRRGESTVAAAGTIGAEKMIDLMILGFLFALVLPYVVLPVEWGSPGRSIFAGALVGLIAWVTILLGLPYFQRILAFVGERIPALASLSTLVSRLLDGLKALRNLRRLPALLFWSALVWMAAVVTNLFLMKALAIPPTLLSALLVVLIIQSGVSIPLAPGNLGVFEALAVLALSLTGVPFEQALAFGILLHIIVISVPLAFGLPWLWRHA
ncbi:MAG: flippase-like domain-containing protein [Caldilineales bacterium]|nr:flippase-like domain-containing protein [Caldilineales bacterium]